MQQGFLYFWWFPHIPSGTNSLNFTVNLRGILKLGEQERCQNSYLNMKILVNSQEPHRTLQATWGVFMSWHHLSSVVIYRLFWPAYYSSYEMTTRTDVMTDKILFLLLSWHQIFTYLFTCFAYGLTFVRCIRVFFFFHISSCIIWVPESCVISSLDPSAIKLLHYFTEAFMNQQLNHLKLN